MRCSRPSRNPERSGSLIDERMALFRFMRSPLWTFARVRPSGHDPPSTFWAWCYAEIKAEMNVLARDAAGHPLGGVLRALSGSSGMALELAAPQYVARSP